MAVRAQPAHERTVLIFEVRPAIFPPLVVVGHDASLGRVSGDCDGIASTEVNDRSSKAANALGFVLEANVGDDDAPAILLVLVPLLKDVDPAILSEGIPADLGAEPLSELAGGKLLNPEIDFIAASNFPNKYLLAFLPVPPFPICFCLALS